MHEKSCEYGGSVSNLDIFSVSFDVSMYKYIKGIDTQNQIPYSGGWIRGSIRL